MSSSNFNNPKNPGLKDKIKKYGSPKKTLIITGLVIIIVAAIVAYLMLNEQISGITGTYSKYYPETTSLYIDAYLDGLKIAGINNSTNLKIKGLPDLLSKEFSNNYGDAKRLKINTLMSQAFGNSFSFGVWNDKKNNRTIERSLIIFPIKREKKIIPLFSLIFDKNKKIIDHIYKGFQIVSSKNGAGAYFISRNNIYIANSYSTLVYIINNFFIGDTDSLFDNDAVENATDYLEKNRLGTIIITSFYKGISKLEKKVDKNIRLPY